MPANDKRRERIREQIEIEFLLIFIDISLGSVDTSSFRNLPLLSIRVGSISSRSRKVKPFSSVIMGSEDERKRDNPHVVCWSIMND